jgi:hypothetical protein
MLITNNFNRFFWGTFIKDIHSNLKVLRWNNIDFLIYKLDSQGLHDLLKIITFNNKSLKEMENVEVVKYLEDIRVLLSDNSFTLKIDEEEWQRLLRSCGIEK